MHDPHAELHAATQAYRAGAVGESFARLNTLKQKPARLRGVDYLRALCFLRMEQRLAALEAAKEELRYFNHPKAKLLLEWLSAQAPRSGTLGDVEFQALYKAVQPFTMVGEARLWSLFLQAKEVCRLDIEGDFFECGVAAGGSAALLAVVIQRHSVRERRVWAFDTFEGMPAPSSIDTHQGVAADATGWGAGTCSAPEGSLHQVCHTLGVDAFVRPVKGLFAETLPRFRSHAISLLHMDGDWYQSTMDILENLYDAVVPGGRIQVDDYGHWEGCRQAVHDFAARRGVLLTPQTIDYSGVWFSK